jgi:hypothetical protein
LAAAAALLTRAAAAAADESKLPPPADVKVEFARDIKPILEQSCLRCHGPERPKSNFRLTDREAALKGGDNGVDVIPGQSGKSPLIHYVGRLVEDMEMPPSGKGEPLTTHQITLLRAWIDQGVVWDAAAAAARYQPNFEVAAALSWITVDGDSAKFRELEWRPAGWNGGAEVFSYQQNLPGGKSVSIEGRALRDDYKVTLDLRRQDLGFTRFGYEQFRKYYDDTGGYYAPFSPPAYSLGQDLHLDVGKAWAEVGLTQPHWPRMVLGYEYQFKEGDKSTLNWGPVTSSTGDTRNIYPSVQAIDEHTHLIRFDLSHDLHGYLIEDNLRAEFSELNTRRTDASAVQAGASRPDLVSVLREGQDQFQIANTIRIETQLTDWWFLSAGYLYSWVDADASVQLSSQDANGQPGPGSAWVSNEILLNQSAHVFNFNSQFRPVPGLTATASVQSEWSHRQAFGDVSLDEVNDPTDPTTGILRYPALLHADVNDAGVEENLLLRYTRLPFTALFAEARLKQESMALYEDEQGGPHSFLRDTDVSSQWQDYRAGFNVSPWRQVSLSGQYKHRRRETDYDNQRDEHPLGLPGEGYPAFIRARDIKADEVEARLVLHPATWLKATLTYRVSASDFRTTTDPTDPAQLFPPTDATPGGQVLAGNSDAHTYGANLVLTPWRRLYLSTTFSYQDSAVTTADNGSPSVASYRGDTYTVLANASYALDRATSLLGAYAFSKATYGQNNALAGLPLGIDYDRQGVQAGLAHRFSAAFSARLQYGYFRYREPTSGHLNDYTAHMVLAILAVKWH